MRGGRGKEGKKNKAEGVIANILLLQDVELEWNFTSYCANLNVNKSKNRYVNIIPCKDGYLWGGALHLCFHGYR